MKQRFLAAMGDFRKQRLPDGAASAHFGRWTDCANEVLKQRALRQQESRASTPAEEGCPLPRVASGDRPLPGACTLKKSLPLNPHSFGYRTAELLSYGTGILLIAVFVAQLARGEAQRQEGIRRFDQGARQAVALEVDARLPFGTLEEPDTSLWAPGRIAGYEASREQLLPPVLGVLAIPAVALEVPVYASSSDLSLDRGAGIIDGMAYPHEPGNIGIAGHRDGYFRVLKDVRVGDALLLRTLAGPRQFRVDSTRVVEKSDTSVLQETDEQRVTLVTCYPFYYVGHAPRRFIVTASLDTTDVNHKQRRN